MPSRIALIWALASGATVVAAGATATYWAHPDFLWPDSAPIVVAAQTPETAPAGPPSVAASKPAAEKTSVPQTAPAAAASGQSSSASVVAEVESLKAVSAGAPAAAAPSAAAPPPQGGKPAFDVVNVAPTGETVVAGRAAPNAKVELRDSGKTVAEATADDHGQFVIIPPALPPGDHSLSLATEAGAAPAETSNAIPVSVPAPEPKTEVATAAPTEKPAGASASPATPLSAPVAGSRIAIQSVEAEANGGMAVRGAADPNGVVRLYLNGAYMADARTKDDGRWSLTVQHGVTPGGYVVRADEINPADAKVVARAEAPFTYPAALAAAAGPTPGAAVNPGPPAPPAQVASAAPQAAAPAAPAPGKTPAPADVVIESIHTHQVSAGNTLWGISQTFYGDGERYRAIFAANANQIRDPHWIYPGQTFVVPKLEGQP